jgi:hypothetical protein
MAPFFIQMSDIVVEGGFSWSGGEPQDVILAAERLYPPPFDPNEEKFKRIFSEVITKTEFKSLLDDDAPDKPWYGPREAITRQFWLQLKEAYLRD